MAHEGQRHGWQGQAGRGNNQRMTMPAGRPSDYTPEIAARICRELASGMSLREVCRADDMPAESTVRLWALEDRCGFSAQYTRAREIGYHSMADELLEICDDASNDWMERNGEDSEGWQLNGEHVQRSRIRLDTRKWLLSKALPKVYGDKLDHTSSDGTMSPKPTEIILRAADDKGDD